jgi:hypothetical protein
MKLAMALPSVEPPLFKPVADVSSRLKLKQPLPHAGLNR